MDKISDRFFRISFKGQIIMEKLVTVVITTYKRDERIVKRALESVCCQTWRPLEIKVVNDAPEEVSLSIRLEELCNSEMMLHGDVSIEYLVLKKHSGACFARNEGLYAAKGKYISFLDDDDEMVPEKIEKQMEGFHDKEVGMVYSPFFLVDYRKKQKKTVFESRQSGWLLDKLVEGNIIGGTSVALLSTDALKSIGGFDVDLLSMQDYDVWLRIAKLYKIEFVPEPLSIKHHLKNSITTDVARKEQGWLLFMKKHHEYYENNKIAMTNLIKLIVHDTVKFGDTSFAKNKLDEYRKYCSFNLYLYYLRCQLERVLEIILYKVKIWRK